MFTYFMQIKYSDSVTTNSTEFNINKKDMDQPINIVLYEYLHLYQLLIYLRYLKNSANNMAFTATLITPATISEVS